MDYLTANRIATIEQLTQLLPDVSLMTIHRDLNELQDQGLLIKVRGGARLAGGEVHEPAFFARAVVNKAEKKAIAAKALPLVEGSTSMFLDAGTTMMTFAAMLPDRTASVLTTGPNIALELSGKSNLSISMCGGTLNKNNLTLSGPGALDFVSKVNIDTAVLVASGYSQTAGFTCGKEEEALIKRQVLSQARTSIMLLDTSKIERLMPYTFGELSQFQYIVTQLEPHALPRDFLEQVKAAGTQIL